MIIKISDTDAALLLNLLQVKKESGEYLGRRDVYYKKLDKLIYIIETGFEQEEANNNV